MADDASLLPATWKALTIQLGLGPKVTYAWVCPLCRCLVEPHDLASTQHKERLHPGVVRKPAPPST